VRSFGAGFDQPPSATHDAERPRNNKAPRFLAKAKENRPFAFSPPVPPALARYRPYAGETGRNVTPLPSSGGVLLALSVPLVTG